MKTSSPKHITLLSRVGLLSLAALLAQTGGAAIITSVVETGGDNEATDTITARWTGQTFNCSVANEPIPGITVGTPYTVTPFGHYAPAFVDRNHRYADHTNSTSSALQMPRYLVGQEYIMSGNDNRDNASYRLDVTVSTAVQVYLLVDNRMGPVTEPTANPNDPPTFGAGAMQWVLDQGWVPVTTGINRAGNPALPDEVGIDEGANVSIEQYYSVYTKRFLAGTFSLFQADNAGRNMYGVVVTPAAPSSYETAVLADGPIAYWRFDYGTPTTAVNIGTLGTAADGTYTGGAAAGAQAPRLPAFVGFAADNVALQCDGVNDFVTVANSLMNSRPIFTLSGWMRRNGPQNSRTGLWGQNDIVEFGYIANQTLEVWTDNGLDIPNAIPDQQWAHLAIVSTGNPGTMTMYTNGVLAGSRNHSIPVNNAFPFNIGGGGVFDAIGANGNYFNGQIDEVALFETALSAAQIATQFQAAFKLPNKTNVFAPGDPIALVNGVNDGDGNAGPPPGNEGVERAIDRITQKYLNFLDLGSGFASTPSLGPTIVQCIRFYTANDAVARDPASYILEGSSSGLGGPWTTIASGSLALPLDRNPGGLPPNAIPINPLTQFNQLIEFPNNTPYTSYRVTFPTLRDAAAANSMQIAEVELLGAAFPAAPSIVTQPNDITTREGLTATFSVVGEGANLSYQWFRKLASEAVFSPIPGATSPSHTTPVLVFPDDNNSQFKVTVANSFGTVESRVATLIVEDDLTPPTIVRANGAGDFLHASILFSEEVQALGATDTFNYSIDGGLGILSAVLSADRKSVTFQTTMQAPDTVYTITVNNILDLANNAIAADSTASFRSFTPGACNGVQFQAFDTSSTAGNAVSLLVNHPNFPNNPRDVALIARMDSRLAYGDDSHEQYGGRMRGVFFPNESGAHIFYLAADDNAELWLSTDVNPANRVRIATETSWSNTREWTASAGGSSVANKRSAPINLVGGQPYYIEALWKEGGGGDHCSVAVQSPSEANPPANGAGEIPASMLGAAAPAGFLGSITLNPALPADVSVLANTVVSFTVGATPPVNFASLCYQWERDDGGGFQPIAGATAATYNLGPAALTDNGAKFRCQVGSFSTAATSREALLGVFPDTNAPTVVSARVLSDLTRIDVRFSELVETTTATDPFNYTIDGVNPPSVALLPDGVTTRLTLAGPVTPASQICVSIQNVTDLAGNVIDPNPTTKCIDTPTFSCGLLYFEAYNNIPGVAIDALLNDPRYPNDPSERRIFGSFDTVTELGTVDYRNDYGGRVYGLFVPPTSGNWVFYLASDDASRLYLNPNGVDAAGKQQIAEETGCCQNISAIRSAAIALTGGGRYYIEGVYKEGGGNDHIYVAARLDGEPAPNCVAFAQCAEALRGESIGVYADGNGVSLAITQDPQDQKVCRDPNVGTAPTAAFTVAATALQGTAPTLLQSQDFNANDGGCTVQNVGAPFEGPWTYDPGAGSWKSDGQGPELQRPSSTRLTCPAVAVTRAGTVSLSFVHRYSFEGGSWDGGQVLVSKNGGAFTVVPGSAFTAGGYNGTVLPNSVAENHGQAAFVETSAGHQAPSYITSVADLGEYNPGDTVTLQFLAANDTNTRNLRPQWEITSLSLTEGAGGSALPVVIQWQRNNGGGFFNIPFARSATLSFTPTLADSGARFRALVSTPGAPCQTSYEATLTVVQINTAPRFNCGPDQPVPCDAGPQSLAAWATGISPHSIVRVPTAYANNFQSGPAGMTLAGTPIAVIADGVLKLTTPVNSAYGAASIAAPVQTFESVSVSWKSYLGDGAGGGADGYSFSLGEDVPADPGYGGEEGTGSGLIVAVDTFDNGAALDPCLTGIEIKWRGAILTCTNVPKDNPGDGRFLRKSQFVDASVTVDATGLATVVYDGNTLQAQIPNYAGVRASRALFWARTGGANDNQWIDDFALQAFPFDASSVEAGQTVSFQVSNDNPGLFSQQPAVSPDGTLTYTPAPGRCGTARVTVVAKDSGGTDPQCGGNDMSAPCTFVITVAPCPLILICPQDVTARCTGTNTPVTYPLPTATDCTGSSLLVTCVPPPGSGFPEGTTPVTCTATDSSGQSATCTFRVIVTCNTCPTAVAKASPNAELLPNQTSTIIISVNNSNACVTLDGSMSADPDGDTLTYVWLADLDGNGVKEPIAVGVVATVCLELGEHEIMLVVDDGRCSATAALTVEVLSACEAVELLIDKVDNADLGRRNKRPLIATLKAACASFDRGNCVSGVNQLEAFQNKVRAQIGRDDPALADEIIALTQEIIDAIDCEKGNNGSGNGEDPPPPGNPPPND